jgi:hypothetical protein
LSFAIIFQVAKSALALVSARLAINISAALIKVTSAHFACLNRVYGRFLGPSLG